MGVDAGKREPVRAVETTHAACRSWVAMRALNRDKGVRVQLGPDGVGGVLVAPFGLGCVVAGDPRRRDVSGGHRLSPTGTGLHWTICASLGPCPWPVERLGRRR